MPVTILIFFRFYFHLTKVFNFGKLYNYPVTKDKGEFKSHLLIPTLHFSPIEGENRWKSVTVAKTPGMLATRQLTRPISSDTNTVYTRLNFTCIDINPTRMSHLEKGIVSLQRHNIFFTSSFRPLYRQTWIWGKIYKLLAKLLFLIKGRLFDHDLAWPRNGVAFTTLAKFFLLLASIIPQLCFTGQGSKIHYNGQIM